MMNKFKIFMAIFMIITLVLSMSSVALAAEPEEGEPQTDDLIGGQGSGLMDIITNILGYNPFGGGEEPQNTEDPTGGEDPNTSPTAEVDPNESPVVDATSDPASQNGAGDQNKEAVNQANADTNPAAKSLPKTGENDTSFYAIAGILITLIGILYMVFRIKKCSNQM